MTHGIHTDFAITTGPTGICTGEVRYTFTVKPGRKAVTWATASGGFSPAEAPSIDVQEVAIKLHPSLPWLPVTGVAFDLLVSDLPVDWFLSQIEERAQ